MAVQIEKREKIMKERIFNYAKTDDTQFFYFNRVADCFTTKMDWYDNDDVDMIVVDATNTSQETDNIFSFLYQTEPNQVWMRFAPEFYGMRIEKRERSYDNA